MEIRKFLALAFFVSALGLVAASTVIGGTPSTEIIFSVVGCFALAGIIGWPYIREFSNNEFKKKSDGRRSL